MEHFGAFVAVLTSVVTAVGLLATLSGHLQKLWEMKRKRTVLIACPPRVSIPDRFRGLRVFSSVRSAVDSGDRKAIVLTSNVSRALRSCDFVVIEPGCDPKIIVVGSELGASKIDALAQGG